MEHLYTRSPARLREGAAQVYRVNVTTGKMEFWKTFGANLPAGVASVGGPRFSTRWKRLCLRLRAVLSQAYVVKGLK